jgi:hypothetical protein
MAFFRSGKVWIEMARKFREQLVRAGGDRMKRK